MPAESFPAEPLLDAVADALVSRSQPMHDVVLVPCQITIALTDEAYAETEPYRPLLIKQIERRLDDELARLNSNGTRLPWWRRLLRRGNRGAASPIYDRGSDAWEVSFDRSDTASLPRYGFEIYTGYIVTEDADMLAADGRTVVLAPENVPQQDRGRTVFSPPSPSEAMVGGRPLATISYTDDAGDHELNVGTSYMHRKIRIGRRVDSTDWVEVPIAVEENVSRDHARLRYNEADDRFELLDVSQYGTKVNGKEVPSSHGYATETWFPLPSSAEITLADTVTLHFEASSVPAPELPSQVAPHDAPTSDPSP